MNKTNKIHHLILKINRDCDNLEFGEARRMIEFNLEELQKPGFYFKLNSNAKTILKHVENVGSGEVAQLTRLEMLQINDINKYSADFDISMLKRTLRNCLPLLTRPDLENFLTADAKTVLATMGTFINKEMYPEENKEKKQEMAFS